MSRTIVGLDLAQEYSQLSYYNERTGEVESVSIQKGTEKFLIPTPADLFKTAQEAQELGILTLSHFIKTCLSFLKPAPEMKSIFLMITMRKIRREWITALREACAMCGIQEKNVFFQSYKESFAYYVLNQKREIWNQSSVLFEYEGDEIHSLVLRMNRSLKPTLVSIEEEASVQIKDQTELSVQQWNEKRDRAFLALIQNVFQAEKISSCFLIGGNFQKEWAVESLQYLCRKRHVFIGQNLYTKGACYGMCRRLQVGKNLDDFLIRSEDLVETNLSMQLMIRGRESKYVMINAGKNWYEAAHSIEVIIDQEKELSFGMKSMMGGEASVFTMPLNGLPDRGAKTTRVRIEAEYQDAKHCRITVKDLGFGELFPATRLVWNTVLTVE